MSQPGPRRKQGSRYHRAALSPAGCPFLFVFVLLAFCGLACRDETGGRESVSDDLLLQAKYETVRRSLAEMQAAQQSGQNIHPDCRTLQLLFLKDLKKLEAPAARQLVKELERTCLNVAPSD